MRRIAAFALPLILALAAGEPARAQDGERALDAERVRRLIEAAVEDARRRTRDRTDPQALDAEGRRVYARVLHLLDTRRVTVHFDETPFVECAAFLQDITDLDIVVSKAAREHLAAEGRDVTLRLRDVKLESCLELLLEQADERLVYAVRHGVLQIGLEEELEPEVVLELYDVSDLVSPRPDFPGPEIGLEGLTGD